MRITRNRSGRRTAVAALGLTASAVLVLAGCASSSSGGGSGSGGGGSSSGGKTKSIVIGFSQAFSSNSWQTANNQAAAAAISVLKGQGKVSSYKFLDANNNVNTQISQINDLILAHVNVILIDPTSATALNGVITKAMNAGIKVLVFSDGPVTSTKPYELEFPLKEYEVISAKYIAQRLHGKGNVLDVRGVAGTGGDQTMQSGVVAGFKPYPGIKIVGSVYGGWDEATTESKVAQLLPSLPKIDAVIQQGGEGYGVAQAFQAAGRPVPLIVMGNRGEELQLWNKQNKKDGYTTLSLSANPGIGASAVYVGYDIATGQKVPLNMTFPNLEITQSTLHGYLNIPTGGVATKAYSQAWTQQNVVG